jgi:hypothetical protein
MFVSSMLQVRQAVEQEDKNFDRLSFKKRSVA